MNEQQQLAIEIFTKRLNNSLNNENWEDLIGVIPIAEKYEISNSLIKRACIKVGDYLSAKHRYDEAIVFLNKARKRDTKSKAVFQRFVTVVLKFFDENIEEFSKKDLNELEQAILPIIEFHRLKYPEHKQIIKSTEPMFNKINYRIQNFGKDVVETRMTFRVQQIKNSLYGDMTQEEVYQELARLMIPRLRELLAEKDKDEEDTKDDKKKDKKKKKRNKKKNT
jgi:hypothetical protein